MVGNRVPHACCGSSLTAHANCSLCQHLHRFIRNLSLQNGLDFDPSKTCAVMVGHKEMCEAVTEILESKGVSKEHILLNF